MAARRSALALTLAALALQAGTRLAEAQAPDGRVQIYLPSLAVPGSASLPCGSSAGICAGDPAWRLRCGGFGAVRDLYAAPDGAEVIGIGDGVVRLRIGAPAGSPAAGTASFEGQLALASADYDRVLTGLRGLGLGACAPGVPGCDPRAIWAVGDRPWVARYDGACWYADAPLLQADGQPATEGTARLSSLVSTAAGGLAVGMQGSRPAHAAHAERVDLGGGQFGWRLGPASSGEDVPPLQDVDVLGGPFGGEAWAVGWQGVVARKALGTGSWRVAATLQGGSARELTMLGSASGWAFGMSDPPDAATLVWRFDGTAWRLASRHHGQALIDAYKAGPDVLLLGLTAATDPDQAQPPVLYRHDGGAEWRPLAGPPPGVAGGSNGHRAIAPLADGRVVYAAPSGIWLFDPALGWTSLLQRVDLRSVVPDEGGAWVLAADQGRTRVLRLEGDGALVDPDPSAAALPALQAMARDGEGGLVAVGPDGAAWQRAAGLRWAPMAPPEGGSTDLADVTVDDAGGIWSAGGRRDGDAGRLLRWNADRGRWDALADASAPLVAVAPLPGGGAVAVGGRTIVVAQPARRCAEGEGRRVLAGGTSWCVSALAPCFAGTCLDGLTSVATAPGALWVADETFVLRHRAGGAPARWVEREWAPSIPAVGGATKPFESAIAALAPTGVDDGWAVFHCCARRDPAGRETSYVVRLERGRWTGAVGVSVPLRDAAIAPDGAALWLAGDRSTVLSRPLSAPQDLSAARTE